MDSGGDESYLPWAMGVLKRESSVDGGISGRAVSTSGLPAASAGRDESLPPVGRPYVSMRPEFLSRGSLDDGDERSGTVGGTWVVLLLLVGSAAVISFLASYALGGVLVRAEVLSGWADGNDPRPRWMATGFCVLLGGFGMVGFVARQLSQAQLRRIDRMAEE